MVSSTTTELQPRQEYNAKDLFREAEWLAAVKPTPMTTVG